MLNRSLYLLLAVAALGMAGVLLLNYPLGFVLPCIGFVAAALASSYRPGSSFLLIPAILPLIGFAPWTGWLTFEELDLLVLATATGGYARCAFEGKRPAMPRTSLLLLVLAVLMSVSILVSMARGFSDAGGFLFGWFQGYDGPMNSVRIGKSFFAALLLLPLLLRLQYIPEADVGRKLGLGMAIGLGTASLAALWERLAFTDLLNFSADYRTTGLFWEMHVGGAALDGWLLLTAPFALWALRESRGHLQLGFSLGLLLLAAYASLTTFSRGVYLALLVSLPLLAWLTYRKASVDESDQATPHLGTGRWLLALGVLGASMHLVFASGGYRALLALLGLVAVSLSMPLVLRKISSKQFLVGSSVGLAVGVVLIPLANFLPKGPYLLYPFLFLLTLFCLYWPRSLGNRTNGAICTGSFVCLMLSAADIANYWGGIDALLAMCAALLPLLLLLTWGRFARQALWPSSMPWQASFLASAIAVSAVVTVFSGGVYMGDRFSASRSDLDGRLSHWRQALSMLQSPSDYLFGKGLGRFPATYYFAAPDNDFPGTYRIIHEVGNSYISLVAPRHPLSFGNIFRISQRLEFDAQGPFVVTFKVKSKINTGIHAEVCEKHLLYCGAGVSGNVLIKPTGDAWQSGKIQLEGLLPRGGPWYAPRFRTFSIGIGDGSSAAELDDVALISGKGVDLLKNGRFKNEMQHWFFSSDREHLPWHVKNLLLDIFFDQGALGLIAFLLLTACALWRLNVGRVRQHELAPYLTAGIVGFLMVGMFDSLMDVPRLALLYYLLILYALSLKALVKHKGRTRLEKPVSGIHSISQTRVV